jgi:hypothetical protein
VTKWAAKSGLGVALSALACSSPTAPAHPTWADVGPILAGECSGCHGSTAASTGNGYRFDFFDMTSAVCGKAVDVLGENAPLAQALSTQIWNDVTSPPDNSAVRPKMPPPPAPYLSEWEWQTIRRWIADNTPRGDMPPGNRPPRLRFFRSASTVDTSLSITALVDDPDGDPVVGIVNLGDQPPFKMDRSGSFSTEIDTSSWPEGDISVSATLCDGWSNVTFAVGTITVSHQ